MNSQDKAFEAGAETAIGGNMREDRTYECDIIPVILSDHVPEGLDVVQVGRDAINAAFAVIHDAFAAAGSPRWGDVAPGEAFVLDALGEAFVRMVAVNGERES